MTLTPEVADFWVEVVLHRVGREVALREGVVVAEHRINSKSGLRHDRFDKFGVLADQPEAEVAKTFVTDNDQK